MTDVPKPADESEVFRIDRAFACDRDTLWAVWTEEKHLKNWWGPAGMVLIMKALDFREGGKMAYGMQGPMGTMWGQFAYRKITPKDQMAYVVSFTDEAGNFTRHPMAPLWPLEVMAVQNFIDEGATSRLRSMSYPVNSMTGGFAMTLAQLDAYLIKIGGKAQ